MISYAGIGSRDTPVSVQLKMTAIATKLSQSNYLLRSGRARGADIAFECGADKKEIYLPWDGFNEKYEDNLSYIVPPYTRYYTDKFHPNPKSLSPKGLKFMSRNAYQILGIGLNDPVEFVLCWTKDGKFSGGTGQACRIAESINIPVFNFKNGYQEFADFMIRKYLFTPDVAITQKL